MYPSELQYKHSVQNKMYPPSNGGYRFLPEVDRNDEVVFSSGGRAVVFKVIDESTGKETALKFFTSEDQNRFLHYREISNYLKTIKSEFLVNFQIIENLIYVEFDDENPNNNYFPGLVMDWAIGVTLQIKIKELCVKDERSKISKLKENFKRLAFFLLSEGIAHGDLKHDNIIVNDNLELVLVDYDGIFIPSFKGLKSSELGTSSFQHPNRKNTDFNQRIDDFSILSIYTSLAAFEKDPSLFDKYYDEQNLLFGIEDFIRPKRSEIFKILSEIPETKGLIFYLEKSLGRESIYIDNLTDLLNGKFPKPSIEIWHTPAKVLIGQKVKVSWKGSNIDFVKINGKEKGISGTIEIDVGNDDKLNFEYGNLIDSNSESYKVKATHQPEIIKFYASSYEIKFDESITLFWEVKNYKESILLYDSVRLDLTNLKKIKISRLEKDTVFQLILISEIDNYQVKKELKVEVFHPVILKVKQDKKITFPNRPVNLSIECKNAQKVTLFPQNIDLTGKSRYEIKTDKDYFGYLIAENKGYSTSAHKIEVEVLKVPKRPEIIAKLPAIEFKVSSPIFIRLNDIEKIRAKNIWVQLNKLFEIWNVFKISTNLKRLYEERKK